MMKRYTMLFLAAVLLLTMLAPAAYAAEEETTEVTTVATEATEETTEETTGETEAAEETRPVRKPNATSGKCGDNLTWALEGSTLTITGRGEMAKDAPWAHLQDQVEKLVLKGGVTTVAEGAFRDFDKLKEIDFGGSLIEIGDQAFLGCEGFDTISLPASFKQFGRECFRDCDSLTKVYCAGNMPHFRAYCLYNNKFVTCISVAGNPWPEDAIATLQQNMGRRYQFATSGEYEMFNFAKPEDDAPAAAALMETEPETQPVTEAPTTAPTEAPTEPATVPTEAPTVAPTEPETQPETEPEETLPLPAPVKNLNSRSWIGLVLILGVLTLILVGALIVKGMKNKEGRYTE